MANLDDYYYHHLVPRTLVNKDDILDACMDIERSFTGRIDVLSLHMFFVEASSMLRNAIKQYEAGFFDAGFYSIRSALELARIIAYFSHQNEPADSDIFKKWIAGGKFPYDSEVRKLLNSTSSTYIEIREALSDFFDAQDARLKQVQKYIHKQGFKTFYHQNPFRSDLQKKRNETIDEIFAEFITNSTVEVAILRLCIDPFPVLLQDTSVMYKVHYQSMTEPFSDKTIALIGDVNLTNYKNTKYYKSHAEDFSSNEELCEATHNLINSQYYDRAEKDKIKKQLNLISNEARRAVNVFDASEDISRIYFYGGWAWYFSSTKSLKKSFGFDGQAMEEFIGKVDRNNLPLDGVFISSFTYQDDRCWVEHNRKITKSQSEEIANSLKNS